MPKIQRPIPPITVSFLLLEYIKSNSGVLKRAGSDSRLIVLCVSLLACSVNAEKVGWGLMILLYRPQGLIEC